MSLFPKIVDPDDRALLTSRQVTWLAVALLLPVLAFIPYLPAWIPLLAAAAVVWRGFTATRRHELPSRPLLIALTLAGGAAIFVLIGGFFGRDPGSALLVLMSGLKLLETRTRRDGMLAVFLGFFLFAVLFFHSQEIPVALYAMLGVWLLAGALLALHDDDVATRRRLGLAGTLLLQSLPVMLLLFFLFPRLPGALWGVQSQRDIGVTGLSETMEPGSISELLRSNAVAFRVEFVGEAPPPVQRYWRGPVLSRYDGRTWRPVRIPLGNRPFPATDGTPITYTLTLEPSSSRWLPALDLPLTPPTGAIQMRDLEIALFEPPNRVVDYTMQSLTDFRFEVELSERRRVLNLDLPRNTAPRAQSLARLWRQTAGDDPEAIVTAALAMFREQAFVYTLSPPRLETDPVDEFLFETRRGFCEHYASAFVFLMRAAGIPARVVTGYQGGELNPIGNYLIVRQSDAHAWTEVWLKGRGWVRVDPTAAVAPSRIEFGISSALAGDITAPDYLRRNEFSRFRLQLDLAWDTTNYYWNAWVLAFNPERQREMLSRLGLSRIDYKLMVVLMVGGVAVVLLAFALWTGWRDGSRQIDPIVAAYERLCQRLASVGLPRRADEGPVEYAQRVADERPGIGAEVLRLTRIYTDLRYGNKPENGELSVLINGIRHLKLSSDQKGADQA